MNLTHSSPFCPQVNRQVESLNKLVLTLLKKKLESWLRSYLGYFGLSKPDRRWYTNETLFLLIYKIEAIIPTKVTILTQRDVIEESDNNSERPLELVQVDELLDKSLPCQWLEMKCGSILWQDCLIQRFPTRIVGPKVMFPNKKEWMVERLGPTRRGCTKLDKSN